MMEYNDYLGIPLKIGDFIVAVNNKSFGKGVVTGFTPTMVRTSCGLYGSAQLMVSTEQFHVSGKTSWMDSERAKYKDQLDPNKPIEKPKVTWRYLIAIVQDRDTNVWSGVVMKLNASSQDLFWTSRSAWLSERNCFDGNKVLYMQNVYKGGAYGTNKYKEEFAEGYSRYSEKGMSLAKIKSHGMENLINTPMPIDQFITSFPKFNLSELRAAGKI